MIELLNYSHDYNLLHLDMQILHFQCIYFFFIMQINKKKQRINCGCNNLLYSLRLDFFQSGCQKRKKEKMQGTNTF